MLPIGFLLGQRHPAKQQILQRLQVVMAEQQVLAQLAIQVIGRCLAVWPALQVVGRVQAVINQIGQGISQLPPDIGLLPEQFEVVAAV